MWRSPLPTSTSRPSCLPALARPLRGGSLLGFPLPRALRLSTENAAEPNPVQPQKARFTRAAAAPGAMGDRPQVYRRRRNPHVPRRRPQQGLAPACRHPGYEGPGIALTGDLTWQTPRHSPVLAAPAPAMRLRDGRGATRRAARGGRAAARRQGLGASLAARRPAPGSLRPFLQVGGATTSLVLMILVPTSESRLQLS